MIQPLPVPRGARPSPRPAPRRGQTSVEYLLLAAAVIVIVAVIAYFIKVKILSSG